MSLLKHLSGKTEGKNPDEVTPSLLEPSQLEKISAKILEAKPQYPSYWINAKNPLYSGKMLKEYFSRIIRLNDVLNALTRDYCATSCPSPPKGCCTSTYEGTAWLAIAQEFEAESKGLPSKKDKKVKEAYKESHSCLYHTSNGCGLELAKPGICIIHFCSSLCEQISNQVGEEAFYSFKESVWTSMNYIFESSLNSRKVKKGFGLLDKTIAAGQKLVEMKYSKKAELNDNLAAAVEGAR